MVEIANNFVSSRRGTILIGVGAALLAAILLVVYLNRYRNSVRASGAASPVLVAKGLIQKGTFGNVIGTNDQFQIASVPKSELKDGAITDASALRGLVATQDIYPGQQLSSAVFAPAAPDALQAKLTGDQRAISIPIDPAHGLIGQIGPSDHVDVYLGVNVQGPRGAQPVLKQLMEDALVLRTPGAGASNGNVVLRGSGPQAAALAWAADNGKLWLVLRPSSGAKPARPGLITVQRLLLGVGSVK